VFAVPTPFPRAERISESNYTISIPSDWVPLGGYTDRSDTVRQLHVWQAADNTAFVTLAMVEVENTDAGTATAVFEAAVNRYDDVYYAPQNLMLIDEATAEDGTLRRSYRMDETATRPAGQLDVFYQVENGFLSVLELYTADSTGNTLVQSLQLILDSLRVNAATNLPVPG
jgi:hypothetical protein